jgi:flavin-dependent dehydrogenase
MLLGDAAGLIDPTTWEGIYFAFKSADIALEAFESSYSKATFSSEALGSYQADWKRKFGKELEHAHSIQRRVYGERMGKLWKLIIHELNSDDKLRRLVTDELSKDMSIANMVEKIPLTTKLRLAAKYSRER